ncbi:hypothetical protein K440DRAFT_597542, partial [Wilcoxina mikolae CBS 423.85]
MSELCVICLESISESCKALPCQHSYDYICLLTWLELRQTCPLCNATVQIIEVFDKASQKLVRVIVSNLHHHHVQSPHQDLSKIPLPPSAII